MDQGAHFHCCDLQVHSPRDLGWTGECPTDDAARRSYAKDFISACRRKGLSAVAITDHHDCGFLPYIREAASNELDERLERVAEEDRITVFPGVELTLKIPCQALLLFDPDVSDKDLDRALAALGISPAPASAPKTNPVKRLEVGLNEAYDQLNQLLKGRFIILPNMNDGGDDSILRANFFQHYKEMHCVGGYVDGPCEPHGKRQIVDGKDPHWGSKRCGLIQTSDARERDFSNFGRCPTWIKWSVASTEAIRQACLAPDSRIRYKQPLVPGSWISGIQVSDSRYFGPLCIDFSSQLNTIIGGRGSGKSTILEYLRWALCDQGYVYHEEDSSELPDFEKRRRHLIAATLKPISATVIVTYIHNGVAHQIRREGLTGKVFLQVGDKTEQETNEAVVQSLAQIQGYSQKQLSNVSVRKQELIRLLTTPISHSLSNVNAEIAASMSDLRQAFERVEAARALGAQMQAINLDLASKREQRTSLASQVGSLPPELKAEIERHPSFMAGELLRDAFDDVIALARNEIASAQTEVATLSGDLFQVGSALPKANLEGVRSAIVRALTKVSTQLDGGLKILTDLRGEILADVNEINAAIASHRQRFAAASSEDAVVEERLAALRLVSEQIGDAERDANSISERLRQLDDPAEDLFNARTRWVEAVRREIEILEAQASHVSQGRKNSLRIRVAKFSDLDTVRLALQAAVAGAAITRPEKFDSLMKQVGEAADPLQAWIELGDELVALARVGPLLASGAELPRTPKLIIAGFIGAELRRIAMKLTPTAAFQLTLQYPRTTPIFEYLGPAQSYLPFEDASPGQQATALIGLLLNQTSGPLVVDQPEDDLDNVTILDVAERLSAAKEHRQIIFSTHNPNLVVAGDAELILNCAYRQPAAMAKVYVADQGAIDSRSVCETITRVMEGGEAAFRLRKERYGF